MRNRQAEDTEGRGWLFIDFMAPPLLVVPDRGLNLDGPLTVCTQFGRAAC